MSANKAWEMHRFDGMLKICSYHDADGKVHREDGPAEEWYKKKDGSLDVACYYLDDERLSQEEHRHRMAFCKLAASATGGLGVSL